MKSGEAAREEGEEAVHWLGRLAALGREEGREGREQQTQSQTTTQTTTDIPFTHHQPPPQNSLPPPNTPPPTPICKHRSPAWALY